MNSLGTFMETTSISLVGVGGQGTLLTSDILARTAAVAGMDVKKSEVHGMAQRGGSVISQVRFGTKVYSPIVADGASDILVSFEKLEAIRWRNLLKDGGTALVNDLDWTPVTVSSGLQPAFDDTEGTLRKLYPKLMLLDAQTIAQDLGNVRAANIVLAGALSTLTPFAEEHWLQALRERLPEKLLDVNVRAFMHGRNTETRKI